MSISKRRREKRRAVHYNTMRVLAILDGVHPDWIPPNNRGNLRFTKYEIDSMVRSIHNDPGCVYRFARRQP